MHQLEFLQVGTASGAKIMAVRRYLKYAVSLMPNVRGAPNAY
jgi:hypothetical protein